MGGRRIGRQNGVDDEPERNDGRADEGHRRDACGVVVQDLPLWVVEDGRFGTQARRAPRGRAPFRMAFFQLIPARPVAAMCPGTRSEEHTSELQSLMRISYAV